MNTITPLNCKPIATMFKTARATAKQRLISVS